MKGWICHNGVHINLATADTIARIDPRDRHEGGYYIRHGAYVSTVCLEDIAGMRLHGEERARVETLLRAIRVWLDEHHIET